MRARLNRIRTGSRVEAERTREVIGVLEAQRGRTGAGPVNYGPDRMVSPDSLAHVLLAAVSRALRGQDCADLGRQPMLSRLPGTPGPVRRMATARAAGRRALPAERAGDLDTETVARWHVEHYPGGPYPAAMIGSPNGAAVHLAAALGVPWLPASFEVGVQWPDGRVDDPTAAMRYGAVVADRILAANRDVECRQVYDPTTRGSSAGTSLPLTFRWRRLPEAYREFLDRQLPRQAPVLLLHDARTWPIYEAGERHSFQLGGVTSGLEPADFQPDSQILKQLLRNLGAEPARWRIPTAVSRYGYAEHGVAPGFETSLRAWARSTGSWLHRILAPRPEVLSAATADLYRGWLQAAGKSGNRCVVECGRLLDPWQVLRAGLVPYWCENAGQRSVTSVEWWLAGSAPFSSVDVLPEAPGVRSPASAGLPQWRAVASFGRRRRALDRAAARGYPTTRLPTRHATEVLRAQPCDLPVPPPLRVGQVLTALRDCGMAQGLLIC